MMQLQGGTLSRTKRSAAQNRSSCVTQNVDSAAVWFDGELHPRI
jgi:hypothetical protein